MRVHRSAQARSFTVLPNVLLQQRRLTYTARGLLTDLLSRPDGWREDGRTMADSSPQGRGAIRRALKELTEAGYYRVVKVRMPDGTIRSESHVFDTPQPEQPGVPRPVPGGGGARTADAPVVKDPGKEPSLPAEPSADAGPGGREGDHDIGREPPALPDERARTAVLTLLRVLRPEPRLRLGEAEALELAPLVAQWLERGSTPADLARALLPGLPGTVHSPVGVLRNRLKRKLPPAHAPAPPAAAPRYAECAECHDPVPHPGICRACAGLATRTVAVGGGAAATPTGAARARVALRAARATLSPGGLAAVR
ncbi:hypothetical protein GCM10009760_56610 [Kitasatospora kazusensis]|uniref:Helix-turn-helix domain-containing protein n=1 Tax=Kitasatospora kazusensis TaxID=407974 RepID=A0ABP5LXP6_9ACTN